METSEREGRPAPARGRRRTRAAGESLSPEAIVQAALEFIEREGAGALTVRRLGAELGVDPTAFYRHFRDKDDLVLACMDRAEQLAVEELADRGDLLTWQDRLRALADACWRISTTYPAIYASAFARVTGGPGERRIVEFLLSTIAGLGLDRRATVLFYRSYADAILSLSGANAVVEQLGAEVAAKDESAWARVYAASSAAEYPVTREHAAELVDVTDRQVFDHTVESLVRAMEDAAARAGTVARP
ncbi:TetR/AcrR family transcriptional regulator [Blastococcus sp. SYSU D00820]